MAEVTDYERVARAEIEEVNRDAGNNPVKVGILTPLTGPGDPVAGFLVARGARLGTEYVRENGGALNRQIAFVMRNDQATAYADGFPQETTTDFMPQLRKIAEFEPDAIINDAVTRQVVDDARAVLGRTTRLR